MRAVKILPALVLFLLASASLRAESAAEVWQKVTAKYAACASFASEGTIVITSDQSVGGTAYRAEKRFAIKFQRPASLLVMWEEPSSRTFQPQKSALYTQEGKVLGLPPFRNEPETFTSLAFGMGAYAGISSGATYFIPSLLLEEAGYLKSATVGELGEVEHQGQSAWKIALKTKSSRWTLIVDRATLAIRESVQEIDVSLEQAQKTRQELIESMKSAGRDLSGQIPEAKAYRTVTTITFATAEFDPALQPGDFAFQR